MRARNPLVVWFGLLILAAGIVLVVINGRVLATAILEMVVASLEKGPRSSIPPYDYSWGTMEWSGAMSAFTRLCIGLILLGAGHWRVLGAIAREAGGKGRRVALIVAGLLVVVAGLGGISIPLGIRSAFGLLAMTGSVDPVAFGEDLPVFWTLVFRSALALATGIILALGIRGAISPPAATSALAGPSRVLFLSSGLTMLGFCLLIVLAYLPFRDAFHLLAGTAPSALDPAQLAGLINSAIRWMIAAFTLLTLHGALLVGVASSSRFNAIGSNGSDGTTRGV